MGGPRARTKADIVRKTERRLALSGVAVSFQAIENFVRRRGKPERVVSMRDVEVDDELLGDLELLLAKHLVAHGVHRVCEGLLARRKVCLPFEALRSHLLTEKSRPLGRLEVEDCWRVCFAWLERTRECRSHPAALEAVRLCLAPSLDALESVTGRLAARAFRAYQQAAVCAFEFHWQKQCDCYFCSQWDWDLLLNSKVKRFVGWMDSEDS